MYVFIILDVILSSFIHVPTYISVRDVRFTLKRSNSELNSFITQIRILWFWSRLFQEWSFKMLQKDSHALLGLSMTSLIFVLVGLSNLFFQSLFGLHTATITSCKEVLTFSIENKWQTWKRAGTVCWSIPFKCLGIVIHNWPQTTNPLGGKSCDIFYKEIKANL